MEKFGNSSKVFSRCFYDFLKFSEVFGNGSEVIFSSDVYDFLKFSEKLRKCSKIVVKFMDVIGNVCNGSQELHSFGDSF